MGNNASVRRFRNDMQDLSKTMFKNFQETLNAQGDELVGNIRDAIEHNVSGHLRDSVRKKDVSKDGKPSVLIMAGGRLTTRRASTGQVFDYALAEEFGTVKESPKPFFYSTVRFYRNNALEQYRETFDETIAENNKVRALRSGVFQSGGGAPFAKTVTVTHGYRGAIVNPNKL